MFCRSCSKLQCKFLTLLVLSYCYYATDENGSVLQIFFQSVKYPRAIVVFSHQSKWRLQFLSVPSVKVNERGIGDENAR